MTSLLRRIASLARAAHGSRPPSSSSRPARSRAPISAGGGFKDDFTVPGIEAQKAQDLLEQRFPAQSGTQATVVFTARDGKLAPAAAARLRAIGKQPHVTSVTDPSPRRAISTTAARPSRGRLRQARRRPRRQAARAPGGRDRRLAGVDVAMAGEVIDGAATGGFPIGEVIGLVLAVVLLIVVLRSLRAAGNALLAAFAGIGLGFGLLLWASTVTDVPGLAPTLAGMLGLGAGIDYALLLAARQQEELRAGHPPREAARRANATAGHAALTAAGIVLVSIAGLIVTGIPFVGRVGVAAGVVVLATALTAVVLLPGALRRERPADACRAASARRSRSAPTARQRTPRIARRGRPRRPRLALLAAGARDAALAAPAAGLELGQPDDRNLGTDATQRQAYDRLAAAFGPGVNGPLVVAVSLPSDATAPC